MAQAALGGGGTDYHSLKHKCIRLCAALQNAYKIMLKKLVLLNAWLYVFI